MATRRLSRRDFLRAGAVLAGGLVAAGCTPAQPPAAPSAEQPAAAQPAATEAPQAAAPAAAQGKWVFWPEWGGKDADALQAEVNKFAQETGSECDFLPIRDHARMIASMSAGNPPDLLMTWDASAVGTWGFEGGLMDLQPYIDANKFDLKALVPMGIASGNLMGIKQIGLPLTNYLTSVLYWNKDAFQKSSLDPETPPTTWEELWNMSEKLSQVESGQLQVYGYAALAGQDAHPTFYAYANGGSIWSDDRRQVTPDSDASIAGLEYVRKFYEKYTTDEVRRWISSAGTDADQPTYPIYSGATAMEIIGEWMPSYVDKFTDITINLGAAYMPYPEAKPEVKGTMTANTNPMVIPAQAKLPDVAWKFIEFITRAENSAEMCGIVGNASPSYEGLKLQAAQTKNLTYKWLLEEVWSKGSIKPMTINSPIGSAYNDAYTRGRASVVEDGEDPVQTMKKVKDEMQPQLDDALAKLNL